MIRWLDGRIGYECDPRQIERFIAACGLDGAKAVATPGIKATFKELEEDSAELPSHLTTAFRGAAARGNYLAADRLDSQFACKEICRWMSRPSKHAWKALKRLCRYLAGAPRLVYVYEQQEVSAVDVHTDTDWAGCPLTRKSTSGGCVMVGKHCMKHWSSTQTSISLSSGEAEFAGVIRGAGQGLGYQALLKDVGVELPLRVWTDSSAAIGICSRQGLGKLRHLDTHTLWIQQAVRTKRVDLRKVDGECYPAGILTKHSISRQRLESLITLYSCKYLGGRAATAPLVKQGVTSRTTMAQADAELDNVGDSQVECLGSGAFTEQATSHGSESPSMPHLDLTQEELDRLHPSLVPPDDEQLDDLANDAHDLVYQKGFRLAEAIRDETSLQGRMRRPLLARLQEQQQHDISSMQNRTRTIRTSGGGVISSAATYTTTATGATTTTTATATTGGRTEAGVVGCVDGPVDATAGHGMDDSRCGPLSSRRPVMHDPFGSCSFPAQAKRVNLF